MKKSVLGTIMLLSVVALAACGNGGGTASTDGGNSPETFDVASLPIEVQNDADPIEGGTLEVGVVMDTQFQGLFQSEFYQDAFDARFMLPSNEELFLVGEDFKIIDGGAANLELDQENKTATITLREGLTWSDGVPVTADDVIFSYEVIGHPDYTGIRFDNNFTNIVGMEEYNAGEADSISGITRVDDRTVTIQYKEVHPGMMQAGGGVWSSALPKHTFEGIEVADMESSDPVRKNPVVFGPYFMSNIVPGESVEYLPNPYYWGGEPPLDKIVFRSITSASSIEQLNSNNLDMIISMPTDTFGTYQDTEGFQMLGRQELSYNYLGFRMGTWNAEEGRVDFNPDSKMADQSLRQAMGYALDNDSVGDRFYNGLRTNASTLIPPVFGGLHNDQVEGFTLDLDRANELLDEAGFLDVDGDGIRENQAGEPLQINFGSMSGGEIAQPLADYYIQQWAKIGLDVQLATGRLIDFQAFYDMLENDSPEIDVFMAAWGTGTDPSPTGLWGPNSAFNYTRFESEENTRLLAAIDSAESFDDDFRKEAFDAWQEYAREAAFAIPLLFRNEILPISDRVTNFTWSHEADHNPWATIAVTAESR